MAVGLILQKSAKAVLVLVAITLQNCFYLPSSYFVKFFSIILNQFSTKIKLQFGNFIKYNIFKENWIFSSILLYQFSTETKLPFRNFIKYTKFKTHCTLNLAN